MRLKTVMFMALCVGGMSLIHAKVNVRFNVAGYYPTAEKRIVLMADSDLNGRAWRLIDSTESTVIEGKIGASAVGVSGYSVSPYNYPVSLTDVSLRGTYQFKLDDEDVVCPIVVTNDPYSDLISSSLRWLRVQRSGSNETLDREPAHFGDSAVILHRRQGKKATDPWVELIEGDTRDMLGGWYADGGYAKFTSAVAYTTYYLLKSYNTNPSLFTKKYSQTDLVDILEEAMFGLSYLMKVMPDDSTFVMQVGGFDSDNGTRLPHEDVYDGKRAGYAIFSTSDMGFTAAALALGSATFKTIAPVKSEEYHAMAVKIYKKAISSSSYKPEWLERGYGLFKDESATDNLLLAAAELHTLTGEAVYLSQAKKYAEKAKSAGWAAWGTQNMLAQSTLAKDFAPAKKYLKSDLDMFKGKQNRKDNIWQMSMDYGFSSLYGMNIVGVGAGRYIELFADTTYNSLVLGALNFNYGLNNWGVSFTATEKFKNSVTQFSMPIYKLQTHLFPEGAIALGPCDREMHEGGSKWILDDTRANYCHPYNTTKVQFFDHADDYMTMETWIFGAAENIYLMTLANTLFGSK